MNLAKDNRRIAIVGNQAYTLIRFRGPLIQTVVAQGFTVYAFMPDATAADCEAVRALGAEPVAFRLDRTGMNPLRDMVTLVALLREFRKLHVDAVLCYFIKPVIYGLWAARLAGVNRRFALIEGAGTVFAEYETVSVKSAVLRRVAIVLYRSALRHAHKVFFLNRDDAELFSETGMASGNRCTVIPGIGIDLGEYKAAKLSDGPMMFVMLTRLLGQKGVREYAAAARAIKRKYPDVRFVLLGGGETNPDGIEPVEVQAWVDEGILEWPGRVSDVQAWLAASHVFVLPSYYREGLPRSTLEAMAKGRAVITADSVGCKETVRPGDNGILVPARDAKALANAMEQMINDPDMVARMGTASRRMAEECFDVRVVNQQFIDEMALLTWVS